MKKNISSTDDQASKLDRKTVERNRRIHMKGLCFKLASLIPPHHFKPSRRTVTQLDQLDYAASYITQLRGKIENLKRKKEQRAASSNLGSSSMSTNLIDQNMMIGTRQLPIVDLRDLDPCIEVILISGLQKNFMLYEVISILQEEGADVVSACFYTAGDKVFHTIHAQVKIARFGVETSRVRQRLQELIY
ncbi:hypothetical protein I3843_12G025300 [Carya illinoinensis]|uniref:BHLH domain-containing protein n=1 Tax=Carya illinoinensis TaxID=32201 RepID=A0A8T1NNB1_CARIL|nr:transcription factor bHLH162-like [Carya illinoinensis]KAG6633099.1 hypothetical protein CIPAW_12G025500 [Carya illinoinensis]KAG6683629.1 hypothetical protein I3842_12G024000 [Carya illinoinensis]KAG7951761.1 hypothetical protein I3843_12G025300 [Carya illinoinensis]